jgi:UDP-3-O-[3-hydroxymyristoyl] glucosamine N-acyltransferase
MKFQSPIAVSEIANYISARILGGKTLFATGINEIHKVEKGDITFVDNEKYFAKSLGSDASIIILNKEVDCPEGKALLLCDNPFEAYDSIVAHHRPFEALAQMIDPSAVIHPTAIIEPNVVIGKMVEIGANTYIQAGAIIQSHCVIGERVEIQSGSIIGTDAFYFQRNNPGFQKWTCGGRVIIEDDVQIGACCTINKGVSGDTIIGKGTKLDCQVMIAHGAIIGKNCLIAAQSGIAGKTVIGDNCVIYGQVGITQNLTIESNTTILAQSGVMKNLEGGKVYFGSPASEIKHKYREIAALKQLPDFLKNHR